MDPKSVTDLARAVPEVVGKAYDDTASAPLRQIGRIAEDVGKTIRLVLFPVQYAAALQDRLESYLDRAVRQVPEDRLITPPESVVAPVIERLKYKEPDNPITTLYINLLSRAMDGERIGEAHPAFIEIIAQLAPDEVVFLRQISTRQYTLIMKMNEAWSAPTADQIRSRLSEPNIPAHLVERSNSIVFRYTELNQPEMFYLFLEHLTHLGLVEYCAEPAKSGDYKDLAHKPNTEPRLFFIRLSTFGRLFFWACSS